MDNKTKNERIGVNIVSELCTNNDWLIRECYVKDWGIDATIEYYDEKTHECKNLLGLQIKCGPSYFDEEDGDAYIFRFDENHKVYWESYLMPLIVVLCNPIDKSAIYEIINEETIVSTGKDYKVRVKKDNDFETFLKKEAHSLKKMPKYIYNYNYMLSHLSLMEAIEEGYDVRLRAFEWVNKSSGRGHISIWIYDDVNVVDILDWNYWFPFQCYDDVIVRLFPWANFKPDREFMEGESDYYDFFDGEIIGKEYLEDESDENKYEEESRIDYILRAGEVAFYELHLSLNELGKSFLTTQRQLSNLKVYNEIVINKRENHEYIDLEEVFKNKHPFLE